MHVWSPDGKLLGRIRIPEVCGNICFGGPKRNRLFMAGSQSLYAVYTRPRGRRPADRAALVSLGPGRGRARRAPCLRQCTA